MNPVPSFVIECFYLVIVFPPRRMDCPAECEIIPGSTNTRGDDIKVLRKCPWILLFLKKKISHRHHDFVS